MPFAIVVTLALLLVRRLVLDGGDDEPAPPPAARRRRADRRARRARARAAFRRARSAASRPRRRARRGGSAGRGLPARPPRGGGALLACSASSRRASTWARRRCATYDAARGRLLRPALGRAADRRGRPDGEPRALRDDGRARAHARAGGPAFDFDLDAMAAGDDAALAYSALVEGPRPRVMTRYMSERFGAEETFGATLGSAFAGTGRRACRPSSWPSCSSPTSRASGSSPGCSRSAAAAGTWSTPRCASARPPRPSRSCIRGKYLEVEQPVRVAARRRCPAGRRVALDLGRVDDGADARARGRHGRRTRPPRAGAATRALLRPRRRARARRALDLGHARATRASSSRRCAPGARRGCPTAGRPAASAATRGRRDGAVVARRAGEAVALGSRRTSTPRARTSLARAGPVAQRSEQRAHNPTDGGSNPPRPIAVPPQALPVTGTGTAGTSTCRRGFRARRCGNVVGAVLARRASPARVAVAIAEVTPGVTPADRRVEAIFSCTRSRAVGPRGRALGRLAQRRVADGASGQHRKPFRPGGAGRRRTAQFGSDVQLDAGASRRASGRPLHGRLTRAGE